MLNNALNRCRCAARFQPGPLAEVRLEFVLSSGSLVVFNFLFASIKTKNRGVSRIYI